MRCVLWEGIQEGASNKQVGERLGFPENRALEVEPSQWYRLRERVQKLPFSVAWHCAAMGRVHAGLQEMLLASRFVVAVARSFFAVDV